MDKVLFTKQIKMQPCTNHRPMNEEMGYVEWQEWAERKTK